MTLTVLRSPRSVVDSIAFNLGLPGVSVMSGHSLWVWGRETTEVKCHSYHMVSKYVLSTGLPMWTLITQRRPGLPTVRLLSSLCAHCALWKEVTLHAHAEQEAGFLPLARQGCTDGTEQLCRGDLSLLLHLPIYSVIPFFYQYALILYCELSSNTTLFYCSVSQLWPVEIFPLTPRSFCHNPIIVLLLLFERFLTFWHYNTQQAHPA